MTRVGVCFRFARLIQGIPLDEDAPLLDFKIEDLFVYRPDDERFQVIVFLLVEK